MQPPETTSQAVATEGYARLSCRLSARIKGQAEQAASLLGQSMTDFTEAALAEKAQGVLEKQERITLSERDFARFVEMIENPPPPTRALRDALTEYRQLKAAHPDAGL